MLMPKPSPYTPEGKARILIDKKLEEIGFTIIREEEWVNGKQIPTEGAFAVEEWPTDSGPMDYALFINGEVLGDLEAKPENKGVPGILAQDERYSKSYTRGNFNFENGFHIPFIYASNGHVIWFRDARSKNNLPKQIAKLHTPTALIEKFQNNDSAARKWLLDNPVATPGIRPYQKEAVQSIEVALGKNQNLMMVAMCTGSGKTRVAAEQIYRLLKSKKCRRILYLVDRHSLAAQANSEFASFEPEHFQKLDQLYETYTHNIRTNELADYHTGLSDIPRSYLENPNPNQTFVYITTVQYMQSKLFGDRIQFDKGLDADREVNFEKFDIPIHAFDCVIADECHRGYASNIRSKWREVLDYFDAIKIGMTATPAAHTVAWGSK